MGDGTVDFVIVGSGAGALTAALQAHIAGGSVVVLEKERVIGGNSALSGGTMWVPANSLMRAAGIDDSLELALQYLDGCVGDTGRATSQARKRAYLTEGPRLIDELIGLGIAMNRVEDYADYYAELPGANVRGRALQCDAFDLDELGEAASLVPAYAPVIGYVEEFPQLALARRTWEGFRAAARVALRTFWGRRVLGRRRVANGSALIGRLLRACQVRGIEVRTEHSVLGLVQEGTRIAGVRCATPVGEQRVLARKGVLIASGGYARNLEMRQRFGKQPASTDWTFANPGETGDVVRMAIEAGAATECMDEGIWIPMTLLPEGPAYLEYERGKPHGLMVDAQGQRYIDEGSNYMSFGQTMYEHHKTSRAIPSWLVMDSRHRNRYLFCGALPGRTPAHWISSGAVKRSNSLEDLAVQCGIDPVGLAHTVGRFNGFAHSGVDEDFQRGESRFSRNFGDPRHGPNPALGAIERPPFFAVAVYPGDLGLFGGLVTDEKARVVREDGTVVEGLYATGNATAPVMGRIYPCTGASIASTMIFGSLAARDALKTPHTAIGVERSTSLEYSQADKLAVNVTQ